MILLRLWEETNRNAQIVKLYDSTERHQIRWKFCTSCNQAFIGENASQNTPTKEGDSYYIVSEESSTAIISKTNDTVLKSQEQTYGELPYGKIPKLRDTSTKNAKEYESSENIANSTFQADVFILKNFATWGISNVNRNISKLMKT